MAHECFADEIAIDFPSAGRVVARICDAFLGEPSAHDVFETELPLTPREAFLGLVTPIVVPMRGACQPCGGRGESWAEPCGRCGGSGETLVYHTVSVAVPGRLPDGAVFRFRVTSALEGSVRVNVRISIQPSVV